MGANFVRPRMWNSVLTELFRIDGSVRSELPKHTHDEYQIGVSLTDTRTYLYRRDVFPVRPGSISVIHPGEVHGGAGLPKRDHVTEVFTFTIPTQVIADLQEQQTERSTVSLPYVHPVFTDPVLARQLRRLHREIQTNAVTLETEELWQSALRKIFSLRLRPTRTAIPHRAVLRTREYIDAFYAQKLSLERLASVSGVTASHLSRLFHREVGMTLHRYQTQRRIDRAKYLLLRGMSPVEIADACGFSHQSHLGLYFRQLVLTGPAAYAAGVIQRRTERPNQQPTIQN